MWVPKKFVKGQKNKYITGWNKYVHSAHKEARQFYKLWLLHGKPNCGYIYDKMYESRKCFKAKIKYCINNENQIKMDIIAKSHTEKQFGQFWKLTNKNNVQPGLPVSVGGFSEPKDVADLFQQHFRVKSTLSLSEEQTVVDAEPIAEGIPTLVTAKEISCVIRGMVRGKSPGHDGLSIEHLKFAGQHLPRVLALLFNLCISHSYLPQDLMHTVVVPIIKNKTGNVSDVSNYRPISLATVVAKVLDSLLDKQLAKHLELHDAQFGFRSGLSTESAILCLKQAVQYYTARKTPVLACFLDLSKAFDLVSYNVLWRKLREDTTLPPEIGSIFKFWYGNQTNSVRWAGADSSVYRLECGVRQGGLSSPRLFNLYMNRLIAGLGSTRVGCHIDGVCVNNISYADDMVLLSPSIGALRKLLTVCESYAEAHGLKYNAKKSEYLVFKSGTKTYSTVPKVSLCGTPLVRVNKFKYFGHWVTDDLKDNEDIERERRSLAVRCNMLARRFARCTKPVKITLFRAYCQSFYTCSLWTSYTQRAYSDLRVQYNNAFRILLGLPWRCSASQMFAEAHTDDFHAIMRKRCASMMSRLRGTTNTILRVFADRWDSPMLRLWVQRHIRSA
ncbi:hypothetical protein JYU34_005936 [Plutella xylostella]|uniref:Reverse transcriptase domain-containing protein n=1 Tax=Plutella xylostella TaxID=51655 RepID=A0ABQ7QUJ6_PLUXY|nr:hypothetical protein JYU34_005936 [Plutella xylostella]